jgi:hypothetical protein
MSARLRGHDGHDAHDGGRLHHDTAMRFAPHYVLARADTLGLTDDQCGDSSPWFPKRRSAGPRDGTHGEDARDDDPRATS